MTYSELLEIVLDVNCCNGCETCSIRKLRDMGLTCDDVDAVYTAKLRAIMKKLDEMNMEVPE